MPTTTKIPASAFDASNALFNGQSILLLELGAAISGLAISTAGVVTQAAHTREVGDCLVYKSSTSGAGILAGDVLHVISVDAGVCVLLLLLWGSRRPIGCGRCGGQEEREGEEGAGGGERARRMARESDVHGLLFCRHQESPSGGGSWCRLLLDVTSGIVRR